VPPDRKCPAAGSSPPSCGEDHLCRRDYLRFLGEPADAGLSSAEAISPPPARRNGVPSLQRLDVAPP
jgi:hypothetical protein